MLSGYNDFVGFTDLKSKPQVRFIRSEPGHCFVVCQDLEPIFELNTLDLAPYPSYDRLDDVSDLMATYSPRVMRRGRVRRGVTPADPSHLEIDLRELGLPVFPAVFISETAGELEVTVDGTRGNQELLGLLR